MTLLAVFGIGWAAGTAGFLLGALWGHALNRPSRWVAAPVPTLAVHSPV